MLPTDIIVNGDTNMPGTRKSAMSRGKPLEGRGEVITEWEGGAL